MTGWLVDAPRWLFLALLVYAPWAFGTIPGWTSRWLTGLGTAVICLWVVRSLRQSVMPKVPLVLLVVAGALILQAWAMCFLRSTDRPAQPVVGYRIAALVALVCFVADTARRSLWRKRLVLTMSLTGVSIVLLGLAQRMTEAPGIFWQKKFYADYYFATFDYHANAGAFLNLCWPLTAGLVLLLFVKQSGALAKAGWSIALAISVSGLFINTSRAASFVTVVLLLLFSVWSLVANARRQWFRMSLWNSLLIGAATLISIGAVAYGVGVEHITHRWSVFKREMGSNNSRYLASKVSWEMLPEAGMVGFGPGSWPKLFSRYKERVPDAPPGEWHYAHQDYLQTIIEWGWLGTALWGCLIFGGIGLATWRGLKESAGWSVRDQITWATVLIALAGVFMHGLVDYPLQIGAIQLYVATMLGILWSSKTWSENREKTPEAAPHGEVWTSKLQSAQAEVEP